MTEYLAVDTEFDQQVACRVTVVNAHGQIVIDTLVLQEGEEIKNRQVWCHGITSEMLKGAPTID